MMEESRLDEETERRGMNVQHPEAPSKFGKVFCGRVISVYFEGDDVVELW